MDDRANVQEDPRQNEKQIAGEDADAPQQRLAGLA